MDKERSEKFLKDHGCATWGNYNVPPAPYKECDISEFWAKFSSYGISGDIEFRQVELEGKKGYKNVYLLVYSDVIFMITVEWKYENMKSNYIPHCYIVGCDHEWKIDVNNRGFGKRVCQKCGYWETYDCSD